jgi:hypothetical protein
MRRGLVNVFAGVLALGVASALPDGAGAAGDDEQAALQADRALAAAIAKGDANAAGALLDVYFTWTDADGKQRPRGQSLRELGTLATVYQGDADVQTHFYGQVETILGTHHNARFVRIWVKRRVGWRAFLFQDTPIATRTGPASVEAAAGQGDCDNPCRTVPYKPRGKIDQAILATWQRTKVDEWKPNADSWARAIADEFLIINNTTLRNRTERVAIARKQQETGIGTPGDPVTQMQIFDFGPNAAVMVSRHVPYRGGKPYTNVRVWVLRDARWQLALSQQTAFQSAPAVAPATAKK